MVELLGATDSRESQTEARTRTSRSRHRPASSISAPAQPLRGDGDRLRRTGRPRAPPHLRGLREAAEAGPTGPGADPKASAPARFVPCPLGRGLELREAPARDPGLRGRGRGSSAEPARPSCPVLLPLLWSCSGIFTDVSEHLRCSHCP